MSHKRYRSSRDCLNCGASVESKFCTECGQENIEIRESVVSMVSHFFSDYFHFDSKFFRSVVPLIVMPGFLTKKYWDGKRTQFIHPLRLFFFITIIFMISTSYFYQTFGDDFKDRIIDNEIALVDTTSWQQLDVTDKVYFPVKGDSLTLAEARNALKESLASAASLRSGFDAVFKNLKYITFLLLPVYAAIFQVLYFKSGKYYVEHLVYMMHVQSFMYCLFSITLILPFLFPISIDEIRHISVWIIMIYVWVSLHVLYRQPWWLTLIKGFVATGLLFFITVFSIIFFAYIFQ